MTTFQVNFRAIMAEEADNPFDLSLKKKKKKKKQDFDAFGESSTDAPAEAAAPAEDPAPAAAAADEPAAAPAPAAAEASDKKKKDSLADLALDDLTLSLSGMKKKKKKRAPGEEVAAAEPAAPVEEAPAPEPEPAPVVEAAPDPGAELGLKKKKKKKTKIVADLDDEIAIEDTPGEAAATLAPAQPAEDPHRDYTYTELLERVFSIMRQKNPDLVAGEKRRFVMKPPQVVRVGTKKCAFSNFADICRLLHRPPDHVLGFLLAELGTSGAVDGSNCLILKGRFQQKQIETVLRRYIREYVTCHTCRSPDTILAKENRLFFLQCETCGSKCSVASIKAGFQALTGKRSAMRAKTAT